MTGRTVADRAWAVLRLALVVVAAAVTGLVGVAAVSARPSFLTGRS